MRIVLFLGILILTGCSRTTLTVDRYAILPSDLPSNYVDSPDPRKNDPPYGQVLDVSYRIKSKKKQSMPYLLLLKVIYKNLEEETVSQTIFNDEGKFAFEVLNDKFEGTGGILTYKAEIMTFDGDQLADFKHRLWFELISFE
jgi:hypothetical protein